MKGVRLEGVSKSFGSRRILNNFNLSVDSGVFFALLGPSGCGKTTVLRLISGLEDVEAGKIWLGDQEITHLPANRRKVNTVFQKQALFPHMTVWQNIAYGLMIRGVAKEIIDDKVFKFVAMMNLMGLENKFPATLSGGQQQRVALARALVVEPDVLLFDEPLSALDQKLKERMLLECANLQIKLKTTFIYITHDQKEALTVADKMAIMNFDGKIEQIDSPSMVYQKPVSRFVADFIGDTTLLEGEIVQSVGLSLRVKVAELGEFAIQVAQLEHWMIIAHKIYLSLRPERIVMRKQKDDSFANSFAGEIIGCLYLGCYSRYTVKATNGQDILVFELEEKTAENYEVGDQVVLHFKENNVVALER